MKKQIAISLLAMTLFSFTLVDETSPILGKWQHYFQKESINFLVIFKKDGSYDGFANKKAFVNGTYRMKHDTLYVSDPTCNSKYEGTYTIEYFGKQDSIKFHVIQDTCQGRNAGVNNLVYKRVK
jgi:hypothetical protein